MRCDPFNVNHSLFQKTLTFLTLYFLLHHDKLLQNKLLKKKTIFSIFYRYNLFKVFNLLNHNLKFYFNVPKQKFFGVF